MIKTARRSSYSSSTTGTLSSIASRSGAPLTPATTMDGGSSPASDEVDRMAYLYALRVALLQQHLSNPPTPPPLSPSPSVSTDSSRASRYTFFGGPKSPESQPPNIPPAPAAASAPGIKRRKSVFSLKKDKDDDKLPKDFLLTFWGKLAAEPGPPAWSAAVQTFLGRVKKGSKSESGGSLRDLQTLLDTFSLSVQDLSSAHIHNAHFLRLLHDALPSQGANDKETELFSRLRGLVQSYLPDEAPPPRAIAERHIKRKPSPLRLGGQGEVVDTVGAMWAVDRATLEQDVTEIRQAGSLEKLYLADLKYTMSALSQGALDQSQRERLRHLSSQAAVIVQTFPNLPSSPEDYAKKTALFFTPPRVTAVYRRLSTRVSDSSVGPVDGLVERCREIWNVPTKAQREQQLSTLIKQWEAALGTLQEEASGQQLADELPDADFESVNRVLETLLPEFAQAVQRIYPITKRAISPSLLPLLRAISGPRLNKTLEDSTDELKAMAVGEYVTAAQDLMGGIGSSAVDGYEKVARWIEDEIAQVRSTWGEGVGRFDPAAIILSRQLPLFGAELQALDKPQGSSSMLNLYSITSRLVNVWNQLCPGQEHGFEIDAFFEPHILAWLQETESNTTQAWVSRAVGMDSWVPEGEEKYSQSVVDLFEFIKEATQTVCDLPLDDYKRALYLIDMSKTVSVAIDHYATTVSALFAVDLHPAAPSSVPKLGEGKLGGKASSWLAKGQQAVKSLDRKKAEGFVIPTHACVKLGNMEAAKGCLADLHIALEAEETAQIVGVHKLNRPERARHVFTVTVMRGESILGKALSKAADGFCTVTDKDTGERLLKTRTVLGQEDPRWEQGFEVSVGRVKTLELTVFDRSLVSKHEVIGSATFLLDPRTFQTPTKDIVVQLNPRGTIHVRLRMEGGEKNDVGYHLATAARSLDRSAGDMSLMIEERMAEYIRSVLSPQTLTLVVKPLKKKVALVDEDIKGWLIPLFDYLNENFAVFTLTLTDDTRNALILSIWRRSVDTLISLVVPPFSPKPHVKDPLAPAEIDVVFKWLQQLKLFFNAEGHGVPLAKLNAGNYRDLVMVGQYLDLPSQALRDKCTAAVKGARGGNDEHRMAEVLLRIARTRADMADYLPRQVQALRRIGTA